MASKAELETMKRALLIKELERKARIAAWNEYIGFGVSKTGGLLAAICGGLDIVNYRGLKPAASNARHDSLATFAAS